jgi:hypothetical protein
MRCINHDFYDERDITCPYCERDDAINKNVKLRAALKAIDDRWAGVDADCISEDAVIARKALNDGIIT